MTAPAVPDLAAAEAVAVLMTGVSEGTLTAATMTEAAVRRCREVFGTCDGPTDPLWPVHVDICRAVLGHGGLPASELAQWLGAARSRENPHAARRLPVRPGFVALRGARPRFRRRRARRRHSAEIRCARSGYGGHIGHIGPYSTRGAGRGRGGGAGRDRELPSAGPPEGGRPVTDTPRRLLARIRDRLATYERDDSMPVADAPSVPAPDPAPDAVPPRREHLYGSTYRVRMSLDEVLAERGRTGTAGLYRRSLAPPGDTRRDTERQREAAAQRAGRGRDVLWPSEPE